MVKGIIYRVPVRDAPPSWGYRREEEIFIPALGIAFNRETVFRTGEDRYRGLKLPGGREVQAEKIGEVDIAEEDLNIFLNYLALKERVEELAEKYLR